MVERTIQREPAVAFELRQQRTHVGHILGDVRDALRVGHELEPKALDGARAHLVVFGARERALEQRQRSTVLTRIHAHDQLDRFAVMSRSALEQMVGAPQRVAVGFA